MNIPKVVSVTDLRKMPVPKSDSPIFVLNRNKIESVILSVKEFQKLVEVYEDYLDSLEAEKVLKDKNTKFIPFNANDYV